MHAEQMSDDELAAIACQGGEDLTAEEEDEAEVSAGGLQAVRRRAGAALIVFLPLNDVLPTM